MKAEWWLVGVGIAQAVALILTLLAIIYQGKKTADAAEATRSAARATQDATLGVQRQADIIERQFAISHRPWVGIQELTAGDPLVFDSDGVHVELAFTVRNAGSSPALNVTHQGHLVVKAHLPVDMNPLDRLVNDSNFVCGPDFTSFIHAHQFGIFLVPDETKPFQSAKLVAPRAEIPTADLVEVYWVGCIGYVDESKRIHGTSFVYRYTTASGDTVFRPTGAVSGRFKEFGLSKAY